jgi:VCBS repeat-containing protein
LVANVLENDYDIDNDNLTVAVVTGPIHAAQFDFNSSGVFQYTSKGNFVGTDYFSYNVTDKMNRTASANVTIEVGNVIDPPLVVNDTYPLYEGSVLVVDAPGVLANDTDPDNYTITAHLVNTVSHGSLILSTNGSFIYTPAAYFTGNDSFTYYARGGRISEVATVSLIVQSVPSAPIAMNDNYTTNEDQTLRVLDTTKGVLANDYDPDEGDVLTAKLVKQPLHGTVSLNPNGTFIYTPQANFNGYDSFTYNATDGVLFSLPAVVRIYVTSINDAPVPKKDYYTVISGQVLQVDAAHGVLKNDTDPVEKQNLTVSAWTQTKNGSVSVQTNGSFIYTPKEGFVGMDRFNYTVKDSGGATANSYVEIEVQKAQGATVIIIIIVIVIVCAVAGTIYFVRKRNENTGTENPQRLFS